MQTMLSTMAQSGLRIPAFLLIVADSCDGGLETLARREAARLECNGFSTEGGVWIDGMRASDGSKNQFVNAKILLSSVECASGLVVMSIQSLKRGLPLDKFTAITISPDIDEIDKHKIKDFVGMHTDKSVLA